jgi:lysine-specific histone demethylase 1
VTATATTATTRHRQEQQQLAAMLDLPPLAQPRSHYHVIVLGAGISGLAAALQIFREAEVLQIPIHVTLVEGRNRVGGRLWTDRETFTQSQPQPQKHPEQHPQQQPQHSTPTIPFPVDLGAGWIHGIDMNPLAELAREAGAEFVTTSEEVTILESGHAQRMDEDKDERAGKIFDQLLDLAVEECWKTSSSSTEKGTNAKNQAAVRWYGSVLCRTPTTQSENNSEPWPIEPVREPPAPHRVSNDISVDQAIGNVIRDVRITQMANLCEQEKRMLQWNLKNVEYALGANVRDLSMRFWDIDEKHAFEGDHVLLRQGYSTVAEYMLQELEKRENRFQLICEASVVKLEYARRSATIPLVGVGSSHHLIEISDTCKVTTTSSTSTATAKSTVEENREFYGDFVVCALPLGVLKEAVAEDIPTGIVFDPPLPFPKQDAIHSVGFGLLNKIYIEFPVAFWQLPGIVDDETAQFGNASTCNPHYYMFFDMGKIMAPDKQEYAHTPAILMTLVSGHEAVLCEQMDDVELLNDILMTLRGLFTDLEVPEPLTYQITRWGTDKFSRGSYTYLPPGCTDQDFHMLQSPINGNGDAAILETQETYRVFFAGEHTTALHPSMAHGALLSGFRAAKEVMSNLSHKSSANTDVDHTIPLSVFRHEYPDADLVCALCGVSGSTLHEGSLLAFQHGPRAVLVHSHCAQFSPEVEVIDGVWKSVFQACHRGRDLTCDLCGKRGATIQCSGTPSSRCLRHYHYGCAEDTGYRFDKDPFEDKTFYCDRHRRGVGVVRSSSTESRRISVSYFHATNYNNLASLCSLCQQSTSSRYTGDMLAYQQGHRQCLIHENCAKYSNIMELALDGGGTGRLTHDYQNIFALIDSSKECHSCGKLGATIECSHNNCHACYHCPCVAVLNWNFASSGQRFLCPLHRNSARTTSRQVKSEAASNRSTGAPHDLFQHALFTQGTGNVLDSGPANQTVGTPHDMLDESNHDDDSDVASHDSNGDSNASMVTSALQPTQEKLSNMYKLLNEPRLVGIQRNGLMSPWNLTLSISRETLRDVQYISFVNEYKNDDGDSIKPGDILVSINGTNIGSSLLQSMEHVLVILQQEIELLVEVQSTLPELDL